MMFNLRSSCLHLSNAKIIVTFYLNYLIEHWELN